MAVVGVVGVVGMVGSPSVVVRVASILTEGERGDMELMCAVTVTVSWADPLVVALAVAEAAAGFGSLAPISVAPVVVILVVAVVVVVTMRRLTEGKARRATSGDV